MHMMSVCVQPLQFYSDLPALSAIKHVLKSQSKTDAELRTVFHPLTTVVSEAVTSLLMDFHSRNPAGKYC